MRPDQQEVFGCYKGLARGYADAGKFREAEAMYKQIVAADEKKANGGRSVSTAALFDDLIDFSRVYRHDHRYEDALDAVRRAQTVGQQIADSKFQRQNQKVLGTSLDPWLSKIELAEIYREMGDTKSAESAFEHSLQMIKDLKLWAGLPTLAEFLDNYATLLRDKGKYEQSEVLYLRSLDTWKNGRHPEGWEVAGTLTNYAALLRKVDRLAEAETLETQAAAIHAKADAPNPVN